MSSSEEGKKNGQPRKRQNRHHKWRRQDDQASPRDNVLIPGHNVTSTSVPELAGSSHRYNQGQRRGNIQDTDRLQETCWQHYSSTKTLAAASRAGEYHVKAQNQSDNDVQQHRTCGAASFGNRSDRQIRNSWKSPNQRYRVNATSRTRSRSGVQYHISDKWKRNDICKNSFTRGKTRKEGKTRSQQGWESQQPQDVVARLPGGGGRGQRSSLAAASTSSRSGAADSQQAATELPGFYYDPDKKKYFRILPGHNNYNPLTTANIQQKQQEEKRQELLEQDRNRTGPQDKLRGSPRRTFCGPQLLLKKQLGQLSPCLAQRCAEESFLVEMERQKLKNNMDDLFTEGDTVSFLAFEPDSRCERILALSDARHMSSCQLDFISFKNLETLESIQDTFYFTQGKVTSICWASVTGPGSHALFSVLDEGPNRPSCARLMCAQEGITTNHLIPGAGGAGLLQGRNYEVKSAWTCAWNSNPTLSKCFSVGANSSSVVIDALTGQRDVINTKSDVFAQRFCSNTPVLLSGTRRGEIWGSDLRVRTRGRGTAMTLRHKSSVCCLHLLRDENYLLASDMQGKIKLWDLRVLRWMMDYPGHVNQYAHIPLILDSKEKFIFAVGQDCHTRMWNLQDGQLLRTIPSIHPATQASRPTIAFSWSWGGEGGTPGLLMGVNHELYWYKLGLSG